MILVYKVSLFLSFLKQIYFTYLKLGDETQTKNMMQTRFFLENQSAWCKSSGDDFSPHDQL